MSKPISTQSLQAAKAVIRSNARAINELCPGSAAMILLQGLIARGIDAERERCAKIASDRAAICADACEKIKAGDLYPDTPNAFATENCARMEAEHIARLIIGEPGTPSGRHA